MPRPPRRFVATVLFTDVVGSTETAAAVGDAAWHAILRTYYDTARREVRRFSGREIDTAGDGFFAAFDSPTDGVHCAMAIVDSMWARGVPIRAGLHTGECELVDGKVGGIAVHIGARVAGLAGAGEVLVTGTVHDLATGARLTFAPRGAQALRGVPGQWNVFDVEPDAGRPELPPLEAPPPGPAPGGRRRRTGARWRSCWSPGAPARPPRRRRRRRTAPQPRRRLLPHPPSWGPSPWIQRPARSWDGSRCR